MRELETQVRRSAPGTSWQWAWRARVIARCLCVVLLPVICLSGHGPLACTVVTVESGPGAGDGPACDHGSLVLWLGPGPLMPPGSPECETEAAAAPAVKPLLARKQGGTTARWCVLSSMADRQCLVQLVWVTSRSCEHDDTGGTNSVSFPEHPGERP